MPNTSHSQTNKGGREFKQILIASDLTAYTDRAFDRAVMLAEADDAAVCVLHAVDPDVLPDSYVQRDMSEAKRDLEREIGDSSIDEHVRVSIEVGRGETDKVVVEQARTMRADLIVMGLSHDIALTSVFRGTTIDKVVRHAPCPVLVVKKRARRPYRSVLAAIDIEEPSRRALDIALHTFPKAKFTIVHADESNFGAHTEGSTNDLLETQQYNQIQDLVNARLAASGRSGLGTADAPTLILETGRASNIVQKHAAQLDPDLVVLGTHGRTGISSFFLGSVAETLLEVLRQDVLVVRA